MKKGKEKTNTSEKKFELIKKFKKTWLAKGINTVALIAILVAIFILINLGMKKWDPTPIDLTKSKDYTLTDESKNRVKNINKEVTIYFLGYQEENVDVELAKQYNKTNSKIKIKLVEEKNKTVMKKKYNLMDDVAYIIIECGKNTRTISEYDIESYDYETGGSVDIAEQKITSGIINVTAEKMPKVYFLAGYTDFTLDEDGYLLGLKQYLEDETLTYESINLLNKQKVPEDCDTLVIMTPNKDFDDVTTKAILNYIKSGGNILWFNGMYEKENNYKNVEKILSEYGVKKFEKGIIFETDKDKIFGYETCFAPEIQENNILKNVKQSAGTVFFNATRININEDKLEVLKVEKEDLLIASEKSYYAKDLSQNATGKDDEKGPFIVGAKLEKTVSTNSKKEKDNENNKKDDEENNNTLKSTLIIYGNDFFISDIPVQIGENQVSVYALLNNKDVALNSIAYLTNQDEEITIRKSYSDSQTTFTPSEKEKTIITAIIFTVPTAIIIIGIVVWYIRKRRV